VIGQVPWSPLWQGLLDGLGWLLARIYDLVPNFGVTIIVLTVLIRLVLFPLGVKQIKSMQAMQAIQPKVRQVQQKYKGNKQRQQEEIMRLYKEHGVNPFSGCWPVLLQFPILIAMYSVIRFPQQPLHLPEDSRLWRGIEAQIYEGRSDPTTGFLGMNLLCTSLDAGKPVVEIPNRPAGPGQPEVITLRCGEGALVRVPYYALALLMIATTYYQSRQMQQASPPGSQNPQQQMLTRVMPLMFGIFGFTFPAGLVVYWTVSNVLQIGQQYVLLKAGHIGPQAWGEAGKGAPAKRSGGLGARLRGADAGADRGPSGAKGEGGRPGGSREGDRKKRPKR
jgi:YidC/Oxa1 family membrane protein insertase